MWQNRSSDLELHDAATLRIDCMREWACAGSLRTEWRELVDRCPDASVFQTYEWAQSWWQVHGQGANLLLITARHQGRLVGVAPLMWLETDILGRRRRVIQFIASHHSDFMDVLVDPEYPASLPLMLSCLDSLDLPWDIVLLTDVPSEAPLVQDISRLATGSRHCVLVRSLHRAAVYQIGDPEQDGAVVRKKDVRRNRNALSRMGELETDLCRTVEDALEWAEGFFKCHIARWAGTDTPSEYEGEERREHFRSVIRWLFPVGYMRVWRLSLDGAPISYRFMLSYQRRIMGYRIAYDLAYAKRSPGSILTVSALEYAIREGYAEVCFGVGSEEYKGRFSNSECSTHEIRLYRSGLSCAIDRFLIAVRDRIQPTMERTPWLRPIGLYIRTRCPGLTK